MACVQHLPLASHPPHLCTSGGREDLACAGPPARTFAVRSPWGWPRRSLALGRFASVEARVRVPIRREMPLYPLYPVRPVCAGALGCGVCGGSECAGCRAVPPSSAKFGPVLASSGGFVVGCGEFLAVCASARECLEFATVPAGLYRCFSSSHSVPALTGVGVKFGLSLSTATGCQDCSGLSSHLVPAAIGCDTASNQPKILFSIFPLLGNGWQPGQCGRRAPPWHLPFASAASPSSPCCAAGCV